MPHIHIVTASRSQCKSTCRRTKSRYGQTCYNDYAKSWIKYESVDILSFSLCREPRMPRINDDETSANQNFSVINSRGTGAVLFSLPALTIPSSIRLL